MAAEMWKTVGKFRIPKAFVKKTGNFFRRHVDGHKGEGSDSMDRGGGQKLDFRVDVING